MTSSKVPQRLIGKIADIFSVYYTHSQINMRFMSCGYEGEPPEGNKVEKVMQWLSRGNTTLAVPLENFGELIEEFMDEGPSWQSLKFGSESKSVDKLRQEIASLLKKSNLGYSEGGRIVSPILADAVKSHSQNTVMQKSKFVIEPEPPMRPSEDESLNGKSKKVFIVHGHSEVMVHKTARLLESFSLTPIILHEQANNGKTIIEKFEHNSDVEFAIVLMTEDDLGASKNDAQNENLKPRARQNVLMELGYFMGRLGRDKICALKESGVEVPSDIFGLVYEEIDIADAWRTKVGKELRSAGFDVDLNKL